MDQQTLIAIDKIYPHPQNPRLVMREDVVESIRVQLEEAGRFSEMHAPIVRRAGGHYETISGHHRVEAARKAGIAEVPCWIAELDDDEAFMALVLSNAQGELSPLEFGAHALVAVPPEAGGRGKKGGLAAYAKLIGKTPGYVTQVRQAAEVLGSLKPFSQLNGLLDKAGGRGKRGGLSAYAARIGKSKQYVSQVRAAAEVVGATKPSSQLDGLLDKAQHLAHVHAAAPVDWPALVEALIAKGWSATDTAHWVGKVGEFNIPEKWEAVFLSHAEGARGAGDYPTAVGLTVRL